MNPSDAPAYATVDPSPIYAERLPRIARLFQVLTSGPTYHTLEVPPTIPIKMKLVAAVAPDYANFTAEGIVAHIMGPDLNRRMIEGIIRLDSERMPLLGPPKIHEDAIEPTHILRVSDGWNPPMEQAIHGVHLATLFTGLRAQQLVGPWPRPAGTLHIVSLRVPFPQEFTLVRSFAYHRGYARFIFELLLIVYSPRPDQPSLVRHAEAWLPTLSEDEILLRSRRVYSTYANGIAARVGDATFWRAVDASWVMVQEALRSRRASVTKVVSA